MEDADNHAVGDEAETPGAAQENPPADASRELEDAKKRYGDLNERFLRLAADFDNFRKRTARDAERTSREASERFAVDILEVSDNLERALHADEAHLREGVQQIRALLASTLSRYEITPIDALNRNFDPNEHAAIAQVPSDAAPGTVIEEVARGYRMRDKVIRYSKVVVSNGKAGNQKEA